MASGEVVIQSMWSPAVAAVRSKGIACIYQPLKEGYRSWGGGLGLATHLSGAQLDAAYEYINWYTSGWVGAYLNRQGYYSAAHRHRQGVHVARTSGASGSRASRPQGDILSPDGKVMEKAGAVRDGGSFHERMGHVACWNSVMDEDRYMVRTLERVHRGVSRTSPPARRPASAAESAADAPSPQALSPREEMPPVVRGHRRPTTSRRRRAPASLRASRPISRRRRSRSSSASSCCSRS